MLMAQALLPLQATHLGVSAPEDREQVQLGNLRMYEHHLKQGKIVVQTTNCREQITFANIRHLMENMTLPELHHYATR